MLTQEETIAVVGEDALAREELKKEFFSNGEDLQSILEEGYALKKVAEVYKKNGWNNLKAGQVSKIRRAWISIDKAEKDRILALARQRGKVLEAVESSIGISGKAAVTANEKVRLIHLRVHPGAALLWADFFGVKTRTELDAAHSNESSERELQVSPANRVAEIFNDFENFRPENLVCKYSDNRKVLENRSPEKISDSAFTILQGLDPNASMGVIRDGDFIKEAWTNLKRELTIVHSRFHRSGNHNGDYQSKNGIQLLLAWMTNPKEILEDVRPTNTRIVGISGAPIKAEALGQLPFVGDTLYFPEADANLISVPQLLSMYPGSTMNFTSHCMEFIGPHGTVLLTARAKYGPGFWICTLRDLKHAATSQALQVSPEDDDNCSESDEEMERGPPVEVGTTPWPNTPDPLPNPVLPHLTAEERARAQEAWKLCALLGHPGQQKLMRDLQNNCFASTALTSVDVANAVKIFGPCPACIEAKMRPPGEPPSTSPPAQHIGECIHVDILPLKGKSLGGHTCAFLVVDEKTGYLSLIPLSSKHAPKLLEAIQQIVGFFKSHGHTVGTICSDWNLIPRD